MLERLRPLAASAVGGAAVGVLAKWVDENGPDWLAVAGSSLPIWIVATVLIGWTAGSAAAAALRTAVFFVSMTATYYLWAHLVVQIPVDRLSVLWFAAALVPCPVLAAVVAAVRTRARLAPLVLGATAALVFVAGAVPWWWRQFADGHAEFEGEPDYLTYALTDLVLMLVLVGLPRSPRRIAATALWATVLAWPVHRLFHAIAERTNLF